MKKTKTIVRYLKNIGREMRIVLLLFLVSLKIIVDLATGVIVAIMLILETSSIFVIFIYKFKKYIKRGS